MTCMENRKDVTVPMPGDWVNAIDEQLEYGDSRSAWIREAVRAKLRSEGFEGNSQTRPITVPS